MYEIPMLPSDDSAIDQNQDPPTRIRGHVYAVNTVTRAVIPEQKAEVQTQTRKMISRR